MDKLTIGDIVCVRRETEWAYAIQFRQPCLVIELKQASPPVMMAMGTDSIATVMTIVSHDNGLASIVPRSFRRIT